MRNSRPIISTLSAAAIALLAFGCGPENAERAAAQFTPLQARLEPAQLIERGQEIEYYGTVQPTRQSVLSSRVMGAITDLAVQAGQPVKPGQILARIQPDTSDGQLSQAEGALAQARAALTMAENNFRRFSNLHENKAASDLEFDQARMQYDQAQGAVRQAEGAVQTASAMADDAVVQAPFSARVVETLVEVGDMAAPGRPLIRIESLDGRALWLAVPESDIHRIEVGQTIPVLIDSRPELGRIDGLVREIVPSADPATHSFTVKIDLGDKVVASGLSGRAMIRGDGRQSITVPASAVHQRGGLELVILRAEDGSARTRVVTTGDRLPNGHIEILSGIKAGEQVVVDAPAPVADGTPIEVSS